MGNYKVRHPDPTLDTARHNGKHYRSPPSVNLEPEPDEEWDDETTKRGWRAAEVFAEDVLDLRDSRWNRFDFQDENGDYVEVKSLLAVASGRGSGRVRLRWGQHRALRQFDDDYVIVAIQPKHHRVTHFRWDVVDATRISARELHAAANIDARNWRDLDRETRYLGLDIPPSTIPGISELKHRVRTGYFPGIRLDGRPVNPFIREDNGQDEEAAV